MNSKTSRQVTFIDIIAELLTECFGTWTRERVEVLETDLRAHGHREAADELKRYWLVHNTTECARCRKERKA